MLNKRFLADQQIIEYLKTGYRINVLTLSFLPLGADMDASVYKADTKHQSYFIKLKKGYHHDVGIDIVELLHEKGIPQIIKPIHTTTNQPILYSEGYSFIVYPFIYGQNGFFQTLTNEQWEILGSTLKKIHTIDVPLSIQQKLRKETYSSKWRDSVRTLWGQIEESRAADDYALNLITFIRKKSDVIFRLLGYAEDLAHKVQNDSPQLVLCHSDIHAGNILLSSDDSIYIVDWDDPILAAKERDLMFIGGGIANVWNEAYQEKLFYKGYGNTEINKNPLAYYRCERIIEDIAVYIQEIIFTSSEHKAQVYQHFIDMFAENGVVDIALGTVEKVEY